MVERAAQVGAMAVGLPAGRVVEWMQGAIAQTTEQTWTSALQLSQRLTLAPQTMVMTMFQAWMAEHPLLSWLMTHPLIAVVSLLVALVIVRRVLRLAVQLTERVLLAIVRSPLWLGKWLLAAGTGWVHRPVSALAETTDATQHQRLATLLDRLEAIRQEQDELLQEVRAILKSGQ